MNKFIHILKRHHKLSPEELEIRIKSIKGFKARIDLSRTPIEKLADFLTRNFGNIWFLIINCIWFAFWIPANLGMIPGIPIFDPYPFGFLTSTVSLEAIVLAIVVLISQNREANITDLREEIDLQVNIQTEHEITKIINMLADIHDHLGIPTEDDEDLKFMRQIQDISAIEKILTDERINNNE